MISINIKSEGDKLLTDIDEKSITFIEASMLSLELSRIQTVLASMKWDESESMQASDKA